MNFVLFDEENTWKNFLPITFTRPVSEIRVGILTIREKWDMALETICSYQTQKYLSRKFPLKTAQESVFISSNFCPDESLVKAIRNLRPRQALYVNGVLAAFGVNSTDIGNVDSFERINHNEGVFSINQVWDIFGKNKAALIVDFLAITRNRTSFPLSSSVTVVGDRQMVFLEEGARAEACIFNTNDGPVYIGKHAEVMEGAVVRGPFALCDHSVLKMSAKVYGATTIGPHSKVGGEISNSVILGYSNKAHDGFLGNSVIGEWCNLGADTNNSNLKNNYGNVKLYNYREKKSVDTGLQFCGLIMGDYSKSGINSMFNTGTVVGVGCNVYGGGFPPTMIPNFSWGGSEGFVKYELDKLLSTSSKVFERRGVTFNDTERTLLGSVYEQNS